MLILKSVLEKNSVEVNKGKVKYKRKDSINSSVTVSYTHLDVYKRQTYTIGIIFLQNLDRPKL